MTLEDLCIPVVKIRMVADLLDIEHHGGSKHEFGFVDIPGQTVVGAHFTLEEVANEIETVYRAEVDRWSEEHFRNLKTIEELNAKIKEFEGRATYAD